MFASLFKRPTVDRVYNEQLAEALVAAAEHTAAAEHHAALASMYASRVTRLQTAMAMDNVPRFVRTLSEEVSWPAVA